MSVQGIVASAVPASTEPSASGDAPASDGVFACVLASVSSDAQSDEAKTDAASDDVDAPSEAIVPAPTPSFDAIVIATDAAPVVDVSEASEIAADASVAVEPAAPAREVSVAELELARSEQGDAPISVKAPMYDAIQQPTSPAPLPDAPRPEPASRSDFADALAARSADEPQDERDELPEPAAAQPLELVPQRDPIATDEPIATHEASTDAPASEDRASAQQQPIVAATAPALQQPIAAATQGAPQQQPIAAATRAAPAQPPADAPPTAVEPIATPRTSVRSPIRSAPSATTTRAAVRAPIRRADAPAPSAAPIDDGRANAPASEVAPRIAATPEPTATLPTIERATTPSATTPTLDAAPLPDAAPDLASARTPTATPSHEPRASAPITHEPITISRAEDLAAAIDRLRPIPKGGAVIEVQTPNLGTMRLEVAIDDGNVRIRIDSDDSRALAWIESEQHGITAAARQSLPEASNVQLELRQQGGDGRHRAPQRAPEPADARGDGSPSPSQRGTDRNAPASTPTIRRGLVDVVA